MQQNTINKQQRQHESRSCESHRQQVTDGRFEQERLTSFLPLLHRLIECFTLSGTIDYRYFLRRPGQPVRQESICYALPAAKMFSASAARRALTLIDASSAMRSALLCQRCASYSGALCRQICELLSLYCAALLLRR